MSCNRGHECDSSNNELPFGLHTMDIQMNLNTKEGKTYSTQHIGIFL